MDKVALEKRKRELLKQRDTVTAQFHNLNGAIAILDEQLASFVKVEKVEEPKGE